MYKVCWKLRLCPMQCKFTQKPDNMKPKKHVPPPILFDELIVEILSRVPVKSLVRFRCVCKSWKSFISDPQFVKLHLHRSSTNADFAHHRLTLISSFKDFFQCSVVSCSIRSLIENPSSTIAEDEDLCYRLKKKYMVLGSCNGMLCLADLCFGEIFKEYWVRLWNPTTRLRSKKSPCLYVKMRSDLFGFPVFGFGYDHISDTYKVVAVLFYLSAKEDSQKTHVKVYSVGDNCWRNIQSFPAVPILWQRDGEFLSGTLNWLAVRNLSSRYEWNTVTIDQLVLVSLDMGKETYRQLLLPLEEVPYVKPTLGVLKDCLCVCHDDYKKTHFVVWQMKEFGVEKSWTQVVNVSYFQTGCLKFPSLLPLCMSENGDVLMLSYSTDQSRAILYNRRDNRLKISKIPNSKNWIHAKVYVESLVFP